MEESRFRIPALLIVHACGRQSANGQSESALSILKRKKKIFLTFIKFTPTAVNCDASCTQGHAWDGLLFAQITFRHLPAAEFFLPKSGMWNLFTVLM